jgi:hypothetical protein
MSWCGLTAAAPGRNRSHAAPARGFNDEIRSHTDLAHTDLAHIDLAHIHLGHIDRHIDNDAIGVPTGLRCLACSLRAATLSCAKGSEICTGTDEN